MKKRNLLLFVAFLPLFVTAQRSNWEVGAFTTLGTSLSTKEFPSDENTGENEVTSLFAETGVSLSRHLGKNFYLQSGMSWMIRSTAFSPYCITCGMVPNTITYHSEWLDIPLKLSYRGIVGDNQFFVGGGLRAGINISSTFFQKIDLEDLHRIKFSAREYTPPFTYELEGEIGWLHSFSDRWQLSIGLNYRHGLNDFFSFEEANYIFFNQSLSTNNRALGFIFGVSYKF